MNRKEREEFEKFIIQKNDEAPLDSFKYGLGVPEENGEACHYSGVDKEIEANAAEIENMLGPEPENPEHTAAYIERKTRLQDLLKAKLESFLPKEKPCRSKKAMSMLDLITTGLTNEKDIDNYLGRVGIEIQTETGFSYAKEVFNNAIQYFNTDIAISTPGKKIPKISTLLAQIRRPEDIYRIFLTASGTSEAAKHKTNIRQACALLRIAMVIDYINRDPQFHSAEGCKDHLEKQIFRKFKSLASGNTWLYPIGDHQNIPLVVSPQIRVKELISKIRKLICKPESTSYDVLDKVGVRLVTRTRAQAFQLVYNMIFNNKTAIIPWHAVRIQESKALMPGLDQFILALSQDETAAQELFDKIAYHMSVENGNDPELIDALRKENPNSDGSYQAIHVIVDVPFDNNGKPDQCSVEFQFVFAEAHDINNGTHHPYKHNQIKQSRARTWENNLVTTFEDELLSRET